jgi:branched-chain amino acid transport system substrate-binding protein
MRHSSLVTRQTSLVMLGWRGVIVASLLALLLAGCSDVRPVAKIGLIAPFEGLHRRTGYEALAAMRLAIADAPAAEVGVIPLALDDSADPAHAQRAAAKLLADPQVQAVVGPLSPALATAGDPLIPASLPWFTPYAVNPPGGFADPRTAEAWAAGLAAAVGAAVQAQGATALVLAGDAQGWPVWDDAAWSKFAGLPVRTLGADPAAVTTLTLDDALFWLGAADEAARFLTALPPARADIPFWLGPAGGDPILAEHAQIVSKLYWLTWSDVHYNAWAATHTPSTPSAFLVYQATRAAIEAVTGAAATKAAPWHVVLFEVENGVSRVYTP